MENENNISAALVAGVLSSIVVACIWAAISYAMNAQWSFMGILAGLVVGWCVKAASGGGKFVENGVIGAVFSLFACILGDFLIGVGYIAEVVGCPFFDALVEEGLPNFFLIAFAEFDFFSFLFYAFAVCIGWGMGKGVEADD